MRRLRRSPVLLAALLVLALCGTVEWAVAAQHTHGPEDCGACRTVQLGVSLDVPAPAALPVLVAAGGPSIEAAPRESLRRLPLDAGRAPPLS